jgi:hypothetical protein
LYRSQAARLISSQAVSSETSSDQAAQERQMLRVAARLAPVSVTTKRAKAWIRARVCASRIELFVIEGESELR